MCSRAGEARRVHQRTHRSRCGAEVRTAYVYGFVWSLLVSYVLILSDFQPFRFQFMRCLKLYGFLSAEAPGRLLSCPFARLSRGLVVGRGLEIVSGGMDGVAAAAGAGGAGTGRAGAGGAGAGDARAGGAFGASSVGRELGATKGSSSPVVESALRGGLLSGFCPGMWKRMIGHSSSRCGASLSTLVRWPARYLRLSSLSLEMR